MDDQVPRIQVRIEKPQINIYNVNQPKTKNINDALTKKLLSIHNYSKIPTNDKTSTKKPCGFFQSINLHKMDSNSPKLKSEKHRQLSRDKSEKTLSLRSVLNNKRLALGRNTVNVILPQSYTENPTKSLMVCPKCTPFSFSKSIITKNLVNRMEKIQRDIEKETINLIIYNHKCLIVSIFKEHLIYNDLGEFLKRFYFNFESMPRIKRAVKFYNEYCFFFPRLKSITDNFFFQKNIQRKKKIEKIKIDEIEEVEGMTDSQKVTVIKSKFINSLANDDLRKDLSNSVSNLGKTENEVLDLLKDISEISSKDISEFELIENPQKSSKIPKEVNQNKAKSKSKNQNPKKTDSKIEKFCLASKSIPDKMDNNNKISDKNEAKLFKHQSQAILTQICSPQSSVTLNKASPVISFANKKSRYYNLLDIANSYTQSINKINHEKINLNSNSNSNKNINKYSIANKNPISYLKKTQGTNSLKKLNTNFSKIDKKNDNIAKGKANQRRMKTKQEGTNSEKELSKHSQNALKAIQIMSRNYNLKSHLSSKNDLNSNINRNNLNFINNYSIDMKKQPRFTKISLNPKEDLNFSKNNKKKEEFPNQHLIKKVEKQSSKKDEKKESFNKYVNKKQPLYQPYFSTGTVSNTSKN